MLLLLLSSTVFLCGTMFRAGLVEEDKDGQTRETGSAGRSTNSCQTDGLSSRGMGRDRREKGERLERAERERAERERERGRAQCWQGADG
jgi:hypothetical protein